MDTKKRKKIVIGLIALALVLFLIILIIVNRPSDAPTPPTPGDVGDGLPTSSEPGQEDVDEFYEDVIYVFDEEEEANRTWDEEDFRRMAKSFAELFGTYSNFSNFENIELSREYMTPSLRVWADSYILDLKENFEYSGQYYALKSDSFSAPVIRNFDVSNSNVEVLVTLERTETIGDEQTRVFSQDLLIEFDGSANDWKVDGVYWQ